VPKKLTRTLHLVALWLLVEFLERLALVYLPLRAVWRRFWGTWARFWCAVRLWRSGAPCGCGGTCTTAGAPLGGHRAT